MLVLLICCWSGYAGTHPTVWILTPGQRGPHTPHCSWPPQDPGTTWHTLTFIIHLLHYPPQPCTFPMQPWCGDPGVSNMLVFNRKRGKKDKEGEAPHQCHFINVFSLEAQRAKVSRSCGLKSSTAEKWICVEIAKRTLASSILGQHAKLLEKLGHS